MTLLYATITLDLPFVSSKKGRRAIVRAIKEHLWRLHCSTLDISGEYPKEATIALTFLSYNASNAHTKIEKIEAILDSRFPDIHATIDYEML